MKLMKLSNLNVILSSLKHFVTSRLACKIAASSLCAAAILVTGCADNNEPGPLPEPEVKNIETSILIYAVASNNLSYDFNNDMAEVLEAAQSIDLDKAEVWVYSITQKQDPSLSRLVYLKDSGEYAFEIQKEYDRLTFSTDPKRISEVISDYTALSESDKRGLIFWSHATGWTPKFSDHKIPEPSEPEISESPLILKSAPVISGCVYEDPKGWYGQDINDGVADYCDLLELEQAIPDFTFDFIWFDCCYMSSIEVVYQLRRKTPYIVAYPTEMAAEGLPYQITLPYLAAADYDLEKASKATSKYFLDKNSVITICLTNTAELDNLAAEAAKATKASAKQRPWASNLQKYSRSPSGPFYDFGQYTSEWGRTLENEWDDTAFREALDKVVIYKAASSVGFDHREINPDHFSGLSCHYFYDYETEESEYYKKLDWYKAVYSSFHDD